MLTPQSSSFPKSLNGFHAWSGTANLGVTLQNKALKGNQEIAENNSARFFFKMSSCKILKEDNYVIGVIAKDENDNYHCFYASKAVVLAAGDYRKNKEMCRDLLTEADDLIEPDVDWSGHGWDGSGIRLGMWAGGKLEPHSYATMGGQLFFPRF